MLLNRTFFFFCFKTAVQHLTQDNVDISYDNGRAFIGGYKAPVMSDISFVTRILAREQKMLPNELRNCVIQN